MHETVIRGGTIVDGNGGPPAAGDLAINGGRITQVGGKAGPGRREIDAEGAIVTPGWVDIHTHYDGQATWDPYMTPSAWHGVTTVVMGNCGVGFAPARPDEHDALIAMMEGVEDIPGTALHEGLSWGWESFPEYLDVLEREPRTIDIGAQVPHCAVRAYVMGQRGCDNEPATAEDIAAMRELVRQGIAAGALGFTTTRTNVHRTSAGARVPGTFAETEELLGIAGALKDCGRGVFGLITDFDDEAAELAWIRQVAESTGRKLWLTLFQKDYDPDQWRRVLAFINRAADGGAAIHAQVAGRPVGLMLGFAGSLNPFSSRPSYRAVADRPLAERVALLRDPGFRARLLAERVEHRHEIMKDVTGSFHKMFRLGDPPDYEPGREKSIAAEAERQGRPAQEVALDALLERDGQEMLFFPLINYSEGNHDIIREMLLHPRTVVGLGDGGAHCGLICDASIPTFMLSHWTRDRARGEKLPLEWVVKAQTRDTAALFGLHDRGVLEPGRKADINIIDHARLGFTPPLMIHDLPAGGRRLVQHTRGYLATLVAGTVTHEEGEATGALPGRLVRGGRI